MYYKAIHIFLATVIFYFQCSLVNMKALIGHNIKCAREKQFPSVVCLKQVLGYNNESVLCTGTLVSRSHVITADHCFDPQLDIAVTPLVVVVGSVKLRLGKKYTILWWLSFTQWATQVNQTIRFTENDIAVAKLVVEVSSKIVPSAISTFTKTQLKGLSVVTAGFGQLNSGELSDRLVYASLTIISKNKCNAIVSKIEHERKIVEENLLCTNVEPFAQLDCGDSGGPLLYDDILVGVNHGNCPELNFVFHPQKVNVHVNIALYFNFINQTMGL